MFRFEECADGVHRHAPFLGTPLGAPSVIPAGLCWAYFLQGGGGEGGGRSPDGLFAQQEREPIRGRPTVRGKRTYGGRPGQRVEEQGTWAAQKHSKAGYGRPVDRGVWTAKTVKRPRQQPAHPQYANYWAPLTRQRHIHATFSTAPTHQPLGSANAETTPAGAPAAAADRKQRPNATCEGKNG